MGNTRARVSVFTGSAVVWGAELSLLAITETSRHDLHLYASHRPLIERWLARPGRTATAVKARQGRVTRLLSFIPYAYNAARGSDVVLVFDFYLLPLFVALIPLYKLHGTRLVIDVHDSLDGHPKRRPYFWLMRFCDRAICISEYIRSQVKGCPTTLVNRPVSPLGSSRAAVGSKRVGVVGQVAPEKRTLFAIEVCTLVGEVHEVVVRGDAADVHMPYLEAVEEAAETGLGGRFRLEGRVERDRVMNDLDILFVANAREPFGRVIVEAQLAEVVVVAPAAGGAGETVKDGLTGYTFAPESREDASRALRRALNASSSLREEAKSLAMENFASGRNSKEYDDALAF